MTQYIYCYKYKKKLNTLKQLLIGNMPKVQKKSVRVQGLNFMQKSTNSILNYFKGLINLQVQIMLRKSNRYYNTEQVNNSTLGKLIQLYNIDSQIVLKEITQLLKNCQKYQGFIYHQNRVKKNNNKQIPKGIPDKFQPIYSSQILSELMKLKYLEACFMYLLAFYGITQNNQKRFSNLTQIFAYIMKGILFKEIQLKEQSQNAEYQEFLERASLQAFSSPKKKLKKRSPIDN